MLLAKVLHQPVHPRFRPNDSSLVPHIKEPHHRLAPIRTVIERSLVHVHPDKAVSSLRIKIAGKLHRVGQSLFAMLERILNAVAQRTVYGRNQLRAQRAANRVPSQRQRQARHFLPPFPQVNNAVQSRLVIGQLPFVDDKSSLILALEYLRNNLIEGHDLSLHSRSKELQREIGSRKRARNRDAFFLDFTLGKRTRRDHHRPITFTHAPAAGHKRVQILNIRIGMKRNRRHIVDALPRFLVQGLNITKRVRETQYGDANLISSQPVKHEGIVRIRAVCDADLAHLRRRIPARTLRILFRNYCHHLNSKLGAAVLLSLRPRAALPPRRDSGSHHHLNYFGKQKPVKSPAESLHYGMRKHGEPAQTSGEKHNFTDKPAHHGTSKTLPSPLHDETRQPRHQRVSQQKSPGGAEQLRDSSRTGRAEHRHTHRALGQIERERRKSPPAAQQQTDQQHAEVLHRERHRRAGQWNRDVRAQRHQQTAAHHQSDLPRAFENAFLRSA